MAALRPSRVLLIATLFACALALPATAHAGTDAVFRVDGRGWGHGVGMSQYGAKGYAEQGWTYDRIMAWYFKGTTLATRSAPTVKVDLDPKKDARTAWRLAAGSSDATLTVTDLYDGSASVAVRRGLSVWITFAKGGAVLRADVRDAAGRHVPGAVLRSFRGPVIAATGSVSTSKVQLLCATGPYNDGDVVWRGQVRFVPDTTTGATKGHAVDYVTMDQYVQGVVPRESPSGWPMEALKAQAVAARSYAYAAAARGSVLYCTTTSQMYNGASCGDASHNAHETARTNTAVAETANRFVVHGSSVVQTFFSSSSGGRTANSKDVWFSSSSDSVSPVYYTSVADADSGSPDYRWPSRDVPGTSLAGTIRSHYPAAAPAAPAVITKVTAKAGTSGWVRYVSIAWSNGSTTTLRGTEFQHALALKSSAFTVTLKTPPPPAPTRFEQSDPRIGWSGPFATLAGSGLSGGSHTRSGSAGAAVTVMFKGSSVAWIGARAPIFGRADVWMDGVRRATVDLYSSSWSYKRALWSIGGLSADATHTLTIKVLGTHGTAAKGNDVAVDAFDVLGTLVQVPGPPVYRRSEQTSSAARFTGAWTLKRESSLSGGSYRYTRSPSASVTFTFTGTRVRVIGKRGPSFGRAWVSVDGGKRTLVDLYSPGVRYRQVLWTSSPLAPGRHTVRVSPSRTRNSRATGRYAGVDAFDTLVPAP